jgi:heptosyltransferase-2
MSDEQPDPGDKGRLIGKAGDAVDSVAEDSVVARESAGQQPEPDKQLEPDDDVPEEPERILIVGPAWVGDMIMAQALFMLLKAQPHPVEIDVVAPRSTLPLLERMAEVNRGIFFDVEHGELKIGARVDLGKRLRGRYQRAIVLPNSLKSAIVPFAAQIEQRTGFRGEFRFFLLNDIRLCDKRRPPLMVDQFASLAQPADKPLPDPVPRPLLRADPKNITEVCSRNRLSLGRAVLGLAPGAEYGEAKRWPAAKYAEVAEHWIGAGGQVWLFGGPGDQRVCGEVRGKLSTERRLLVADLAGKTSLLDAIDLISMCDQMVSNDSGLMHIAAALQVPTVVVYGSSSPAFTPPLSSNAEIVTLSLPCSPCFKRTCPLKHLDCLNKLPAAQVIELLPAPSA